MLQGTAYLEILREVVLPVESEHSFALHAVLRIALQRYIDLRPCIQDALVKDGHLACRIVHAIVGTLLQDNATCRDHHRALRHVIGAQRDDIGRRTLELTRQPELVLVRHLSGGGTRGIVEFLEGIFGNAVFGDSASLQEVVERLAEGFD